MTGGVLLSPAEIRGLADWMVRHGAVETESLAPALTVCVLRRLADEAEKDAVAWGAW